ncbi:MAG: hypothetical protein A2091_07610 [Desulfuromonadales bacterium GWD2_61_12]|nr:MAG: hypothetical protein A2005_12440 [Desulfuromonadales bacterium GWC2_61_20]OGR33440.1 MAG: hypothetical protein A2091_07610 [Desulfuromonadales bacterium GWD2_61_12]HAD03583.1 hypothetical protein [Desulfuromonas sp.]HBT84157.1 hypothetical protein [Desulfuromonas sp.]
MILRGVELRHFGRFGDFNVEFRKGMNLVSGANEAGKSTLMEAIPAVIFGLRQKERFRPWGRQGSCEAAVIFENGGQTIRIERDLLSDQVTLTESDDLHQIIHSFAGKVSPLGRSSERAEYCERLSLLFGHADEELFRASLFFGQGSLEFPGEGGLLARIKALLSGSSEVDYDAVLQSLCDDYFSLTRINPWGKDKTRERELDELRTRIANLEGRWFAAREALHEVATVEGEIGRLRAEIEAGRSEYDKGVRYLDWVRRQWHLDEKEQGLKRDFNRVQKSSGQVESLVAERQGLLQDLAKTGLPRELPDDLPLLLADAEQLRRRLIGLQGETTAQRQLLHRLGVVPWRLTAGLSLVCLGGSALLGWLSPRFATPLVLAGGICILILWAATLWQALRLHRERGVIDEGLAQIELRRADAQGELKELDLRFQRLGMSPSAVEIAKMQKNMERHRQIVMRLVEVEGALKVLEQPDILATEQRNLTRELVIVSERLERDKPMRPAHLTAEDLPEAEAKLEELNLRLRSQEERLIELTRQVATLQGGLADLQGIEEEGERLRTEENRLNQRKDALALGYELLREAVQAFRGTHLERFSNDIGSYLGQATQGRHRVVRIADDFSLQLAGKGGRWHDLAEFSRGTIDAAYFAVRLALTRQLAQGRALPLFLDDPLVNFDRIRLAEGLKLLERLSSEHQVIYFSHSELLQKRAARDRWRVVSLEEQRTVAALTRLPERSDDGEQLHLL